MIRVKPDWQKLASENPDEVHDAILAALLRVPAFPGRQPIPVVIVLPSIDTQIKLDSMHYIGRECTLLQALFDLYRRYGLHGFECDGESDESEREAEADEQLLALLRSHPHAVLRDVPSIPRECALELSHEEFARDPQAALAVASRGREVIIVNAQGDPATLLITPREPC